MGSAMTIVTSEARDPRARAADLGCASPDTVTLLPLNFATASTRDELVHASETATLRKLLKEADVQETPLEQPGERYRTRVTKSADLVLPTIFVAGSFLSENPTAVAIAINVISDYVVAAFRGLGSGKTCKLSVVVERTKNRSYMEVSYEGSAEGLRELPGVLEQVQGNG